jgi:hypothetical protein
MWISKIGATGKPLVLGLTNAGTLVNFADLTAPVLRMRSKTYLDAGVALEFPVTIYSDSNEPAQYNAQVVFDFTNIVPGDYVADVLTMIAGVAVKFPDDTWIHIRFLPEIE